MATQSSVKPTGAVQIERRKSGQFDSGYTDQMRYKLVEAVTTSLDPIDPASVSQPRFDREAPAIAAAEGWPEPPSARAICMRLGKAWQLIKEEATENRNIQQILARADGVSMAPWFDEPFVYYAVRRVHLHLGKSENETLYPHEYERGRDELIAKAKRLGRETATAELLPTRGQLLYLFAGDWDEILRLAQLPARETVKRGHPLMKLAEHYYESIGRLPPTVRAIKEHATEINVRCPQRKSGKIEDLIDELIADRAKRQLPTPVEGPVEGARLSPKEIEALVATAPLPQVKRSWTEDTVIEAFADFAEAFEGSQKLNNALYNAQRVQHGWPSSDTWQKHGRFQELVEKGRKQARARRGKAA